MLTFQGEAPLQGLQGESLRVVVSPWRGSQGAIHFCCRPTPLVFRFGHMTGEDPDGMMVQLPAASPTCSYGQGIAAPSSMKLKILR